MDFSDIKTVNDLVEQNKENKTDEEIKEHYKQLIDSVFNESTDFGILLSERILLSLTNYCAKLAEEADNTEDCMHYSITGAKFGSAYRLIKGIEI